MEKIYFKWVPTREGLPEDSERVLVKLHNRSCWDWGVAVWNEMYECWDDSEGDDYMYDKDDVEYWMRIRA